MQFGLAHGALEPEQEPVVEQRRMIDAVGIADQCVGETAQIDEAVPVGVVARQTRDLKPEHEADVTERNLGGQAREPRARDGAGTGEPEILVDDCDALGAPAEIDRLRGKRILPFGRLAIVLNLGSAGLAQIDDGLAGEMTGGDLDALIHRSHPSPAWRRACGR